MRVESLTPGLQSRCAAGVMSRPTRPDERGTARIIAAGRMPAYVERSSSGQAVGHPAPGPDVCPRRAR